MRIIIYFVSPNGTTRLLLRRLSRAFPLGTTLDLRDLARNPAIDPEVDLIGLAGPVYHLREPSVLGRFARDELPKYPGRPPVFLLVTYCGISTGFALKNLGRAVVDAGFPLLGAGKFLGPHHWGDGPLDYPGPEVSALLDTFAQGLVERVISKWVWTGWELELSYQTKLIRILSPLMPILGRLRSQRLTLNQGNCTHCGRCVKQCPSHALTLDSRLSLDRRLTLDRRLKLNRRLCIHCYHCAGICPSGGITTNFASIKKNIRFNQRIVGLESPSNWIFGPGPETSGD